MLGSGFPVQMVAFTVGQKVYLLPAVGVFLHLLLQCVCVRVCVCVTACACLCMCVCGGGGSYCWRAAERLMEINV